MRIVFTGWLAVMIFGLAYMLAIGFSGR